MNAAGSPSPKEVHYDANDRYYLTTFIPLGNDYFFNTSVDIQRPSGRKGPMAENFEVAVNGRRKWKG